VTNNRRLPEQQVKVEEDTDTKSLLTQNQFAHPRKNYMQEQVGNLIRYINDNKMTVTEASAKVNMTLKSGKYYYTKYLENSNHTVPTPHF
jgi:hypothetical protein